MIIDLKRSLRIFLLHHVDQVGGVRQVTRPRKSESEKPEKAKPSDEDVEEFGEDKKEKQSTAVVSGAKTGDVSFENS